jgi:hypothetical protein
MLDQLRIFLTIIRAPIVSRQSRPGPLHAEREPPEMLEQIRRTLGE